MSNPLLEAALAYARRGWPVLPLHQVRDGRCTCSDERCGSLGKHPRTRNGVKDATTHEPTIRAWWQRWPQANLGIAMGAVSGLVAVDVDPRHGGDNSLERLIELNGTLPATLQVWTGGNGWHLLFSHPGRRVANRADLRPGIDIRGDDGYVVAAPSVHHSGGTYQWEAGHGPGETAPAPLPDWLVALLEEEPAPNHASRPRTPAEGDQLCRLLQAATSYVAKVDGAVEGGRNSAAFCLAGHLAAFRLQDVALRLTEGQILDLLRTWNHANQPPLPEAELAGVVASALKNGKPRADHVVSDRRPDQRSRKASPPPKEVRLPEAYRPFPVEVLPPPVGPFVAEAARAIGCDASFVALPLLAALAAAIGNTRCIRLKRGWQEPSTLWTVILGDSGTLKTPAFKAAVKPARDRQAQVLRRYQQQVIDYEEALLCYERDLAAWKKGKTSSSPPKKPDPPPRERLVVSDVTVEGLASLLAENPRGLLLARDELAGWIGSFDRYAGKAGADAPHWLSMHNAESLIVDRKTGARTVHIPMATVSVTGGVQPDIFSRILGREHRESGLLARLLLAMPPMRVKCWTEAEPSVELEQTMVELFIRLYEIPMDFDDQGTPRPLPLTLTPEGREAWISFYGLHAREQADLESELRSAWSKLEGYAARLALVVHMIRWAAGDATLVHPDQVDEVSINAGVAMSRWFGQEARRVYGVLGESDEDREARQLIEMIGARGGSISVRELQRGCGRFRQAEDARQALEALVEQGLGRWEPIPPGQQGGRPSQRFILLGPPADITPPEPIPEEPCADITPAGASVSEVVSIVRSVNELSSASEAWGEV